MAADDDDDGGDKDDLRGRSNPRRGARHHTREPDCVRETYMSDVLTTVLSRRTEAGR